MWVQSLWTYWWRTWSSEGNTDWSSSANSKWPWNSKLYNFLNFFLTLNGNFWYCLTMMIFPGWYRHWLRANSLALCWPACMRCSCYAVSFRVGKYRDIFENIENILYFRVFRYIYQAFAHTLLKLYEIYYLIIVCVCALHIRWCTLVIHTALLWRGAIWRKLSNTEKMLRAQVISQQNTDWKSKRSHNVSHLKIFVNLIKIENIRYFWTKISDIYQANPGFLSSRYHRLTMLIYTLCLCCCILRYMCVSILLCVIHWAIPDYLISVNEFTVGRLCAIKRALNLVKY